MTFGELPTVTEEHRTVLRELRQKVQECVRDGPAVRSTQKFNQYKQIACALLGHILRAHGPRGRLSRARRGTGEIRETGLRGGDLAQILLVCRHEAEIVSTVRADAERRSSRKVGAVGDSSRRPAHTTAIDKSLRRDGPTMKPPRLPILVRHLAKVAESKLLTGASVEAKVNRTALALASTCVFLSKRVGDLV